MKTTTTECAALLQSSDQVYMVEVLTLTLLDATVIRWAGADIDVVFGATTWLPGPIYERDNVTSAVGLEVKSCNITLHADDEVTVKGVPLLQAARLGALDGASLKIEKGFAPGQTAPLVGLVHLFEGNVADLEINGTTVHLTVRDFVELLDTMVPVDVYQPGCLNVLYGPRCGLNKAANSVTFTLGGGSTRALLMCAVTGSEVYDLGELTFISGVNTGLKRAVKRHTSGQLLLSFPLPEMPTVGDSFTVARGCNKAETTCTVKFSNRPRFRGYPDVPAPETAV